jgi:putative membrane protein
MFGHSVIYEGVEWAAAEIFGGELGVAYLGTQGDPWDAQKDMALAALGTTLSLCTIALRAKRAGSASRGAHARRA